jgi:hypothetical protein
MLMTSERQLEAMEEALFVGETQSSSFPTTFSAREEKYCLHYLETQRRNKIRARTLLSYCLYRRVLIVVAFLILLTCTLNIVLQDFHREQKDVLDIFDFGEPGQELVSDSDELFTSTETETEEDVCLVEEDDWVPDWVNFRQ